jgi:argininosuccinate lyase
MVAAGKLSRGDADKKIRAMQIANDMAHVEASVESGEMTCAEADKLYEELGYR